MNTVNTRQTANAVHRGFPADALGTSTAQARSAVLERQIRTDPERFRVLTGDRPTGRLHLGHYFGTLHNRVRLQNLGVEMFVLIADYQVLTDRDVADNLTGYVEELVLDYLAVGVDPARSTIFTHSAPCRPSTSYCFRSSAWSPSPSCAATPP